MVRFVESSDDILIEETAVQESSSCDKLILNLLELLTAMKSERPSDKYQQPIK